MKLGDSSSQSEPRWDAIQELGDSVAGGFRELIADGGDGGDGGVGGRMRGMNGCVVVLI